MKLRMPVASSLPISETSPEFPFCSNPAASTTSGTGPWKQYKVAVPMMDESEPEEIEANEPAQREHPRAR